MFNFINPLEPWTLNQIDNKVLGAWSTRAIKKGNYDDFITIQFSSPPAPFSPGHTESFARADALWGLDTDRILYLKNTGTAKCISLLDYTGNGNHFSKFSTEDTPDVVVLRKGVITLYFNANQILSSNFNINNLSGKTFSYIASYTREVTGNSNEQLFGQDDGGFDIGLFTLLTANNSAVGTGSGGFVYVPGLTAPSIKRHVLVQHNGAFSKAYADDNDTPINFTTIPIIGTATTTLGAGNNFISSPFKGFFDELIFFDGVVRFEDYVNTIRQV